MERQMKPGWVPGRHVDDGPERNPRLHFYVIALIAASAAGLVAVWLYPGPAVSVIGGLAVLVVAVLARPAPRVDRGLFVPNQASAPRGGPRRVDLDLADESPTGRSIVEVVWTETPATPAFRDAQPARAIAYRILFSVLAVLTVIISSVVLAGGSAGWSTPALVTVVLVVAGVIARSAARGRAAHPWWSPVADHESSDVHPYSCSIDRPKAGFDAYVQNTGAKRRW